MLNFLPCCYYHVAYRWRKDGTTEVLTLAAPKLQLNDYSVAAFSNWDSAGMFEVYHIAKNGIRMGGLN